MSKAALFRVGDKVVARHSTQRFGVIATPDHCNVPGSVTRGYIYMPLTDENVCHGEAMVMAQDAFESMFSTAKATIRFAMGDTIADNMGVTGMVVGTPYNCTYQNFPAYNVLILPSAEGTCMFIEQHACESQFKLAKKKSALPVESAVNTEPTPPKFAVGDRVRHTKGGIYTVAMLPTEGVLEHSREPAYSYRMEDGRICHRCQSEFEDGRFVKID